VALFKAYIPFSVQARQTGAHRANLH